MNYGNPLHAELGGALRQGSQHPVTVGLLEAVLALMYAPTADLLLRSAAPARRKACAARSTTPSMRVRSAPHLLINCVRRSKLNALRARPRNLLAARAEHVGHDAGQLDVHLGERPFGCAAHASYGCAAVRQLLATL